MSVIVSLSDYVNTGAGYVKSRQNQRGIAVGVAWLMFTAGA
ncbi:hypothetical protein [Selenomonas sp. AE3005]|nr:hypothetical protein [Selenomonas sp. AE3005]